MNQEDYDNLVNLTTILLEINRVTSKIIEEVTRVHCHLQEALDTVAILREEDVT